MVRNIASWGVLVCLTLAVAGVCVTSAGYAQEEKAAAKKEREKAKGYLPPYYKDVIDGVQREKVYAIQSSYEGKIDSLTTEVKALRDKRDAEIEALLTSEQKKRLQELVGEAKTKRDADTKAKASSKAGEAKAESK